MSRCGSSQRSPERRLGVTDGGPPHLELNVVPGGPRSVDRGHALGLGVPGVPCIVAPAVAQVDATDERHVLLGTPLVAQYHEFLVVRPEDADPLVEQTLTAGGVDLLAQVAILRGAELESVEVRPPDKSSNVDTASGRCGEHLAHLCSCRHVQPLVRIAPPVREQQKIARSQPRHLVQQPAEVHRPVHQRQDCIPL